MRRGKGAVSRLILSIDANYEHGECFTANNLRQIENFNLMELVYTERLG